MMIYSGGLGNYYIDVTSFKKTPVRKWRRNDFKLKTNWLVVEPSPLKHVKQVSWDSKIPKIWENQKFMFQTTNQAKVRQSSILEFPNVSKCFPWFNWLTKFPMVWWCFIFRMSKCFQNSNDVHAFTVNPGLINPGWLIAVVPPNNSNWLLKWYPPNRQPRVY